MYHVLENKFYANKYLIQMRSQATCSGIKLLKVHGTRQNLDPNLKPEIQHTLAKQGSMKRLHVGQGRAGSKRMKPDPIRYCSTVKTDLSNQHLTCTCCTKRLAEV